MSSWTIKEGNGTESTAVTNGETLTIAQGSGIQSEMTSTSSGGTITITKYRQKVLLRIYLSQLEMVNKKLLQTLMMTK